MISLTDEQRRHYAARLIRRRQLLRLLEKVRARPTSEGRELDELTAMEALKMIDEAEASFHKMIAATEEAERKQLELAVMEAWVTEERKTGRPEQELTWGNCVRELGLLRGQSS